MKFALAAIAAVLLIGFALARIIFNLIIRCAKSIR